MPRKSNKSDQPEQPRFEPEIIPPDRARQGADWRQPVWRPYGAEQASGTYRVYVGRVGPFGIAALMLAFAALVGITIFAVLGALLIWIPVIAAAIAVGAVFRFLRR
jgi:hypothetical protein